MKHFAYVLVLVLALAACSGDDAEESSVSFGNVSDGDTVSSPLTVEFETAGDFTIEEAGEINENAGHMHVMVDVDCVAVGEVIPGDDNHIHFGDGRRRQTWTWSRASTPCACRPATASTPPWT